MPVLWQITDLSTQDADGNYQDDVPAGVENVAGFALDTFAPGDDPVEVTVSAVEASLWRYRKPYELTGPTVAPKVFVATSEGETPALTADFLDDNVSVTIPADTMESGQSYQLVIEATRDDGLVWVRTREYRAVAG
jgi:hypothetical protein